jgi:PAS domain S-box-containing protein
VDAETQRVLEANPAAARTYGYRPEELAGLPLTAVWPAAAEALALSQPDQALRLARQQRRDGRPLHVAVQVRETGAQGAVLRLVANEVSERAFSLALMESQSRVLELIARGAPLEKVLESLIVAIERLSSDMVGSVLLLSDDGWHCVTAPRRTCRSRTGARSTALASAHRRALAARRCTGAGP